MRFSRKQHKYISLLIITYIIVSCFSSYTYTSSSLFARDLNSDFSHTIYTTSFTSSNEDDICTPELLGRQELISRQEASHKTRSLSHTHKTVLNLINIADMIHIPLYHSLYEYISTSCEPRSTSFIIRYIHRQDGKKKDGHSFLS